jgi:hypothetical protein
MDTITEHEPRSYFLHLVREPRVRMCLTTPNNVGK